MYKRFLKRGIDLAVSVCLLPLVAVIGVFVGWAIWSEDRGDLFYMAPRRGLNGRIFKMYKFRSMKMNAPDIRNTDNSTYNAPDDPRVTRIGQWLRKTSIDELPQLFNVLKGDMSLIGPRPVTTNKPLEEYDEKRWTRLEVKPGMTGYSQAYFRNSITSEEKIEKDAWYARNVNFVLDMRIVFATIHTVLFKSNIYNSTNV